MDQNSNTSTTVVPPASPSEPSLVANPTVVSPDPAPVVVAAEPPKSHKKMIWIIIIGLILMFGLGAAGYYFYTQKTQVGQSEVFGTPTSSPPSQEFQQLENDVNSTPIDDVDTQFIEVDKDIQKI